MAYRKVPVTCSSLIWMVATGSSMVGAPMPTSTIRAAGAATVKASSTAGAAPLHSMITSTGSICSARGPVVTSTTAPAPRFVATASRFGLVSLTRHVGPAGAGDVGAEQAHGTGSGDQHAVPGLDGGLAGGPDGHRQRFDQRGGLVGDVVRHRMGPMGRQDDVLREGAVDRRGGEELDVRAQVVAPGQALAAASAGLLRLQRHPLTDPVLGDPGTDRADRAGGLVPEHQGLGDDEVGDPAVLEVVHVRAADADGGDLYQHLARARLGDDGFFDVDLVRLDEP